MDVTETDKKRCETIMSALRRGTYTLDGGEVLAFNQAFEWVADLYKRISVDVASKLEFPPPPPHPETNKQPTTDDVQSPVEPTKEKRGRTRGSQSKSG